MQAGPIDYLQDILRILAIRVGGDKFVPRLLAYFEAKRVKPFLHQYHQESSSLLSRLPVEVFDHVLKLLQDSLYDRERGPWEQFVRCQAHHTCNYVAAADMHTDNTTSLSFSPIPHFLSLTCLLKA